MIQTIDFTDFLKAFKDYNREENFTHEGLRALFDYLEEYEKDTQEPLELDVIALCCNYSEYKDLDELQKDYSDITGMNNLEEHTQVIHIPDSPRFIIQNF